MMRLLLPSCRLLLLLVLVALLASLPVSASSSKGSVSPATAAAKTTVTSTSSNASTALVTSSNTSTPQTPSTDATTNNPASSSSSTSIWKDTMKQRVGAKIMSESALMDKETGRIFWEGGQTSTVAASISPLLSDMGLHRAKSTILSVALVTCLLSLLASYLRTKSLFQSGCYRSTAPLPWPLLVFSTITKWTVLQVPRVPTWFLATVLVVYFIESYYCNTRKYLANAVTSPDGVETYLEKLRHEQPLVSWKVRCFHYEKRMWASLFLPTALFKHWMSESSNSSNDVSPSWFTKKVVTHTAESNYTYKSCVDNTVAGVWKRATALGNESLPRFTKIRLAKLLVLSNKKTRQDYFAQQAAFVTEHGQNDEYAEFSTNVDVPGFQPRLLAVRKQHANSKLFKLHMFWIFTSVGMSLPYRIWFSRRCDELRVSVAKETTAKDAAKKSSYITSSSWSLFKSKSTSTVNETSAQPTSPAGPTLDPSFRRVMQELSLYERKQKEAAAAAVAQEQEEQAISQQAQSETNESTAELLKEIQDASEAAQKLAADEAAAEAAADGIGGITTPLNDTPNDNNSTKISSNTTKTTTPP